MARYIGIDWDHDQMYLVSFQASRGKVTIEKATVWKEVGTPGSTKQTELGKALVEFLKTEKIAPAPIIACVGRERLVFKEFTIPPVGPAEEPAMVRFQASKELTEPADRVLIDYAHGLDSPNGQRRLLVGIAKKQWVQSIRSLCEAADLKLEAVAPRSFGIAACLKNLNSDSELSGPPPARGSVTAVVAITKEWAEFTVVRDGNVLLARALPQGDALFGDVRRNLALFASQNQQAERSSVEAIYFAGGEEHAVIEERLREMLAIPVYSLDPFSGQQRITVTGNRGGYCGVVGLGQVWQEDPSAVINFVHPKEPKVETNNRRQTVVVGGGLLVLALLGGFFARTVILDSMETKLKDRRVELAGLEDRLKAQMPIKEKAKELDEWDETALPWLDELYNLKASFPYAVGFKINRVSVTPITTKTPGPHTMRVTLNGVVPRDSAFLVQEYVDAINLEKKYYQATIESIKGRDKSKESSEPQQEFVIRVDVAPRDHEEYTSRIEVPEWVERPKTSRRR